MAPSLHVSVASVCGICVWLLCVANVCRFNVPFGIPLPPSLPPVFFLSFSSTDEPRTTLLLLAAKLLLGLHLHPSRFEPLRDPARDGVNDLVQPLLPFLRLGPPSVRQFSIQRPVRVRFHLARPFHVPRGLLALELPPAVRALRLLDSSDPTSSSFPRHHRPGPPAPPPTTTARPRRTRRVHRAP